MYQCRNCGGNLKFDISSQQLACEHCSSYFNPFDVEKEHDAEEDLYEINQFTCPQCGAEIMASENSASEFCMFCGGTAVLSSRISKQKKPDSIIPFKKTKEECIKSYAKLMRRALFAPKELKNPAYLEKFKGIYMPYWIYDVVQQGPVTLKGTTVRTRGNYEITSHYDLNSNIEASYTGLSHDASSNFSDNITECLAPYNIKEAQYFTPSMLSGFYADTSDVNSSLYVHEALEFADSQTYSKLSRESAFSKYTVKNPGREKLSGMLHTAARDTKSTLFPVWFLSYRNKDRIMYSTVNGQTGKVVADVPINITKYIIGSLIVAIPLFFLFNMLFVLRPSTTMVWSAILSLLITIIYAREVKRMYRRENGLDDVGLMSKSNHKKTKKKQKGSGGFIFSFIVVAFLVCLGIGFATFERMSIEVTSIIPVITMFLSAIISACSFKNLKGTIKSTTPPGPDGKIKEVHMGGYSGFLIPLIAIFVSCIIMAVNPVSDLWYYGGTFIAGAGILVTIAGIISKYNVLSTHKIPQLHDRGGDSNVQ